MGLVVGTGATAQREPRYPIHVRRDGDPGLGERDQVPVDRDAVEARPDESLAHLGVARGRLGGGQRAQNIEAAACDAKAALAEECAAFASSICMAAPSRAAPTDASRSTGSRNVAIELHQP